MRSIREIYRVLMPIRSYATVFGVLAYQRR
ncbi:MAG: hypothetical protein RL326_1838 [Pseudomonadota bacterium]|jgi:hypothetical protein